MRIVGVSAALFVGLVAFGTALVSKSSRWKKAAWWLFLAMMLGALLAWLLIPMTEHMAPPRGI